MKILHWAWILIAIILPISIVCRVNVNARYSALRDEVRINNAIDTATNDAIDQIITANGAGFDYDSEFGDVINITPALAQEAINTFFTTMGTNYNLPFRSSDNVSVYGNSTNSYIQNYFSTYIPAVVVVAYDGFYIYGQQQDNKGYYGYKLSTKIPYTYTSPNGYTIGYTLGEDIYLYIDKECYSGRLQGNTLEEIKNAYSGDFGSITGITTNDVASLTNNMSEILYSLKTNDGEEIGNELLPSATDNNFLQDYKKDNKNNYTVGKFHENRRKVIIQIISDTLKEQMNVQNHYADLVGCTYDFGLPEISEDDWINSIDDISIMAFVQGIPIGSTDGIFYNNYALGGSRIVERDYYYGAEYTNANTGKATLLYHKKNCQLIKERLDEYGYFLDDKDGDNIFINEDDAIVSEYHACQLCH